MRFVRIKSAELQRQLMQHRTRDALIRQRTQIINALRSMNSRFAWEGHTLRATDRGVRRCCRISDPWRAR
jgi:transposase